MVSHPPISPVFPQMKFGEVWLDVAWDEFLIPSGPAPAPGLPNGSWAIDAPPRRSDRLSKIFKPAGRYDPRVVTSQVHDEGIVAEAYKIIDRPWAAAEVDQMLCEAERILARTGFVTSASQHFLWAHGDTWFIWADRHPEMPASRDAVEGRYDGVVLADPARFDILPETIADAAGGPYGRLAWAMEVVRRSRTLSRFAERAANEIAIGRLGAGVRNGDGQLAADHLAWLLSEAYHSGWSDGAYFESVRVSDVVARAHREASGAQATSARSLNKTKRQAALAAYLAVLDPAGHLSDLEIARRAQQAHADDHPLFSGVVDLLDANDPANPKDTAKEIAALRKTSRPQHLSRHVLPVPAPSTEEIDRLS